MSRCQKPNKENAEVLKKQVGNYLVIYAYSLQMLQAKLGIAKMTWSLN